MVVEKKNFFELQRLSTCGSSIRIDGLCKKLLHQIHDLFSVNFNKYFVLQTIETDCVKKLK